MTKKSLSKELESFSIRDDYDDEDDQIDYEIDGAQLSESNQLNHYDEDDTLRNSFSRIKKLQISKLSNFNKRSELSFIALLLKQFFFCL